MSYLNLLATVHCPVTAVGKEVRNSFGITIATCTDTWTATAMVALINYGVPSAEDEHSKYLEREDKLHSILRNRNNPDAD